jgi:hypothetical protein
MDPTEFLKNPFYQGIGTWIGAILALASATLALFKLFPFVAKWSKGRSEQAIGTYRLLANEEREYVAANKRREALLSLLTKLRRIQTEIERVEVVLNSGSFTTLVWNPNALLSGDLGLTDSDRRLIVTLEAIGTTDLPDAIDHFFLTVHTGGQKYIRFSAGDHKPADNLSGNFVAAVDESRRAVGEALFLIQKETGDPLSL